MSASCESRFLPYGRQVIETDDIEAVAAVLRGDWVTTGPAVAAFEEAFARRVGARFAVACSSGTAALHLTTLALGLGSRDASVVPSMTFLATANASRYTGAEVVFADVDTQTGLLGEDELATAIEQGGDAVRAIYPVHLNGQTVDMAMVTQVATARGLRVVEDACHALGASYRGDDGETIAVGACAHSDMAIFSGHPVKTICMGEGGVVTTNDAALYERLTRFRNHGMIHDPNAFDIVELAFDAEGSANPWYYEMPELGFNYRATDFQCALGLSQLGKLDRFVDHRLSLAARYDDRLTPLAPMIRPVERVANCSPAWHLYAVLIDFERTRTNRSVLMQALKADGIGSQVHYIPVHRQPYYVGLYGQRTLPGADRYYAQALSLPLHVAMTTADVDRVVLSLTKALGIS